MSRSKTLADWGGYATSQYVARFATMIRGFVIARLLGPEEYGNWVALLVIYQMGAYVHLGILNGMDREIPFWLGRENRERAWGFRDAGFTAVTGLSALLVLALIAVDLVGWKGYTSVTRLALPLAGVAVLLQNQVFLHYNIFRSTQRIGPVSQGWALQGILDLALSVPAAIFYGVHGLFVALVITNLSVVAFLRIRSDWSFRLRASLGDWKRLLVRGGPVLAYLFMEVLLRQVDKFVIIAFLSREQLGFYGIAFTVASMLRYITSSASFTLFPNFLAKFGETGEISSLARTLKEPTFAFSIFIPVFLGLVMLWIHIPVVFLLPKFLPGLSAMRILVCGAVFFSLASLSSYFLITVNRTRVLLLGGAAIVILEAALNTLFIRLGYGIHGVALGSATCQFLYGTILLAYAFHLLPEGERSVLWMVGKTYLPTIYTAAAIVLLFLLLPIREETLRGHLFWGTVRGAILLAVTSPFWILLQRRTGVFTLAWDLVTRKPKDS
ncbi:MAG: oligosaccharide flippase family protein [Candidatus Eisenbacteria bacterium]|nr:oligosaccharide flippase family protein [Candidatus Eisenbacteria bacterium]